MIKLKKFTKKNITKQYISWLNNKDLMKFSRHKTVLFDHKLCENFYNEMKSKNNLFYAIYKNTKHIGNIIAYLNLKNSSANLSIMVSVKGTGFEAWNKALELLLQKGVKKVYAGTNLNNLKMINICLKSKMVMFSKTSTKFFFYKNLIRSVNAEPKNPIFINKYKKKFKCPL